MSDPRRNLLRRLPGVRDDMVSVPAPFDFPVPDLDIHLSGTQFSIYDPRFTPVILTSRNHGTIIANNTYLSGFADNVALAWMLDAAQDHDGHPPRLVYNLKKFYAEQLLRYGDSAFGRALLLETLLYEEAAMREAFAARSEDPTLRAAHDTVRSTASGLLLFHELGHLVQQKRTSFRAELVADLPPNALGPEWDTVGPELAVELEADAFAIALALQETSHPFDRVGTLRLVAFCFMLFTMMLSLDASAEATIQKQPAGEDDDMLDDIYGPMHGATYVLQHHPDHAVRAASALRIVAAFADAEGLTLFGTDGGFPLPADTYHRLHQLLLELVSTDTPANRPICELLARSFHGHRKGFDFLLWRSKTFELPTPTQEP